MMRRMQWTLGLLAAIVLVPGRSGLWAQSPPNCSANRLAIELHTDTPVVAPGGLASFTASVRNDPNHIGDACDIQGAFVQLCCPGFDGNPLPGPAGCTLLPVAFTPCMVNGNCVPTAEASSGLTLPANGFNDVVLGGLGCQIDTLMGQATAQLTLHRATWC